MLQALSRDLFWCKCNDHSKFLAEQFAEPATRMVNLFAKRFLVLPCGSTHRNAQHRAATHTGDHFVVEKCGDDPRAPPWPSSDLVLTLGTIISMKRASRASVLHRARMAPYAIGQVLEAVVGLTFLPTCCGVSAGRFGVPLIGREASRQVPTLLPAQATSSYMDTTSDDCDALTCSSGQRHASDAELWRAWLILLWWIRHNSRLSASRLSV